MQVDFNSLGAPLSLIDVLTVDRLGIGLPWPVLVVSFIVVIALVMWLQ